MSNNTLEKKIYKFTEAKKGRNIGNAKKYMNQSCTIMTEKNSSNNKKTNYVNYPKTAFPTQKNTVSNTSDNSYFTNLASTTILPNKIINNIKNKKNIGSNKPKNKMSLKFHKNMDSFIIITKNNRHQNLNKNTFCGNKNLNNNY